jgi:hypothetical protein
MESTEIFQYSLIDAELTAAISYCRAAATSENLSRKARNMEEAERAWQVAQDFTRRTNLTRSMQDVVEHKTEFLQSLLSESRKPRVIFKLDPINLDFPSNKRTAP